MTTNSEHVQHNLYAGHFKPDVSHYAPIIPQHSQYHTNQQDERQFAPIPINVMQANTDIDSLLQIHRRKMIRRAANRRSAQQSRARKKALMGDLKIENQRLQKFADILDSQPELTFCIDKNGQITFMSDSALNIMKSSNADDNDDDPTHISQILTGESVGTVLDCVAQIRADQCSSHGDHDGSGCISSVQSVCYHDASGFQVAGYIRCSRLIKRAPFDDGGDAAAAVDMGACPVSKKSKTGAAPVVPLTASNIAAASSSSGMFSLGAAMQQYPPALSSSLANGDPDFANEDRQHIDSEEEFVCAIRPADASFPHSRDSQLFSSLLSTASIVAHDLELRSSTPDPPLQSYGLTYSSQPTAPSYERSTNTNTSATYQSIAPPHPHPLGASYPYQTYGSINSCLAATERCQSDTYLESVGDLEDQPL